MQNLQTTAEVIEQQLNEASALSMTLHNYGHMGQVVEDGTVDGALLTDQMIADYNAAIDTVINTQYYTARDLLIEEHQNAIDDLHTAINDLTAATAVLATVSAVADMASTADTVQEQLQVQAALNSVDMSIEQSDVDNYNSALTAVESYANAAAGFLTAANTTSITTSVDSYASSNNINLASYTMATFSADNLIIMFDNGTSIGFGNYTNTMSADEVYANAGIYGGS